MPTGISGTLNKASGIGEFDNGTYITVFYFNLKTVIGC